MAPLILFNNKKEEIIVGEIPLMCDVFAFESKVWSNLHVSHHVAVLLKLQPVKADTFSMER